MLTVTGPNRESIFPTTDQKRGVSMWWKLIEKRELLVEGKPSTKLTFVPLWRCPGGKMVLFCTPDETKLMEQRLQFRLMVGQTYLLGLA